MPISDWSSDVCSSDLLGEDVLGFGAGIVLARLAEAFPPAAIGHRRDGEIVDHRQSDQHARRLELAADALADDPVLQLVLDGLRSEEHTSELQSLMRISYAVFCLKKKKQINYMIPIRPTHCTTIGNT